MKNLLIVYCYIFIIIPTICSYLQRNRLSRNSQLPTEESVLTFLSDTYEYKASKISSEAIQAEWNFLVDLGNKTKQELSINATIAEAHFEKEMWSNYFKDLDTSTFQDRSLARQVKRLSVLGNAALEEDRLTEFTNLLTEMTEIYSTSKICPYSTPRCDIQKQGITLDPDIENVFSTSCDYDELLYTWQAWRDATGAKMKEKFESYVVLSNQAARANNFTDKGEMWRYWYESPNLDKDLERIWEEVQPLYNELHQYVLTKLKTLYQREIGADTDGLIPAHLLGNIWGQSWTNLRRIVKPFPEESDCDITYMLKKNNFTALKMFEVANEFYTSLGLESMSMAYNTHKGAVIEKPKNKSVVCHASAWDFNNQIDYRIKMCSKVTQKDFFTIHHELGHIQYYLQYHKLPIAFRAGANPGFHEAIGDSIGLSVATPKHLHRIGLTENYKETPKIILNALMDMALDKVAFLPYGLLLDKWRWDIFSEKVDPSQWNDHYWHYREKYQKLKSPLPRTADDFDAAAKYHVIADSQYISYFFAHILEFQIHKALCIASGQCNQGDDCHLAVCDIYKSKQAGCRLKEGLKLGASRPWKEVLQAITNEKELSGSAILEYFKPLYNYLVEENKCN